MLRIVVVCLVGMLVGCAGAVQIVPNAIMGEMQEVLTEAPTHTSGGMIEGEILVSVHAPYQGLHMANSSDEARVYTSYSLPEAPEGMGGVALEAFYESFYAEMREARGTRMIQQFEDAGPALVMSLEHHLRQHFRHVRVALEEGPGFVIEMQGESRWRLTKSATMTLLTTAGPSNIPPMQGSGSRRTGVHLGWAIPVVLIGGLMVGALIVSPIIGGISRSHFRGATASALNEAAAAWASAAADAWRSGAWQSAPNPGRRPAAGPATPIHTPTSLVRPTTVQPAPVQPAPSVACQPDASCAAGFICHEGQCLSACNPACASNEMCIDGGECVSLCNPPCSAGAVCSPQQECVIR